MPLRFHRLAPGCRVSGRRRRGRLVNWDRHWVRLVYSTFGRRLSGRTAVCLLIPAQGATWPTHPEVNWSLRERAAVPAAAPKIKLLPSASVAGADGGFRATWDSLRHGPYRRTGDTSTWRKVLISNALGGAAGRARRPPPTCRQSSGFHTLCGGNNASMCRQTGQRNHSCFTPDREARFQQAERFGSLRRTSAHLETGSQSQVPYLRAHFTAGENMNMWFELCLFLMSSIRFKRHECSCQLL